MNSDEPPLVPLSAMKDLHLSDAGFSSSESLASTDVGHLTFCFCQPGCSSDFVLRVIERKVLLETIAASDESLTLSGVVRVANISYQKKVVIRYTTNSWMTHSDSEATYLFGSNDGATDRFTFTVKLPSYFTIGNRLEFSVMYMSGSDTFWDSNFGVNYRVECYKKPEFKTTDFSSSNENNLFY